MLVFQVETKERVLSTGAQQGFEWVTCHNGMGCRSGYVRVPHDHPWFGLDFSLTVEDYDGAEPRCHGGITFAEADADFPHRYWWLGFDCSHSGDAPDPALPRECERRTNMMREMLEGPLGHGEVRSQEFVETECRKLCEQAQSVAA
jgi:hypothetical protein